MAGSFFGEIPFAAAVFLVAVPVLVGSVSILLTLLILGLALRQKAANALFRKVSNRYDLLFAAVSTGSTDIELPAIFPWFFFKPLVKMAMLKRIFSIGASGRKGLVKFYREKGFTGIDRKGLGSSAWWVRVRSCDALGVAGDPGDRALLLPLLKDGSEAVRVAASMAIVKLGAAGCVTAIIGAMGSASAWGLKSLSTALAGGGQAVFLEVVAAIGIVKSHGVRAELVEITGNLGDARAVPLLLEKLVEPDTEIRIRSARALGRIRDRRAAFGLEKALGDPAWEVRAQAAKSLGVNGDEADLPPLEKALDDPSWWVRYNSAKAMAAIGKPGLEMLSATSREGEGFKSDIARQVLDMAALGISDG